VCKTEQEEHQQNAGRESAYIIPLNHKPSDLEVAPPVKRFAGLLVALSI
jgi:hypothetical protein